MTPILIFPGIKDKLPNMALGVIESVVTLTNDNADLWEEIQNIYEVLNGMEISDISSIPAIKASRDAYKICGKDPARYRLSAEALLRRVVKGLELPKVNNLVDLLNLVSIKTGNSIGGYDAKQLRGDISMGIGIKNEPFQAIGRGDLNIEFLPVLRDQISAFGSPTSDSLRTSVTLNTSRFMMVIFGFSGETDTSKTMEMSVELLIKYAKAIEIRTFLIR